MYIQELAKSKGDMQVKPTVPVTPASASSSQKNQDADDTLSITSTLSSSAHASSSGRAGSCVSTPSRLVSAPYRNFTIPDTWRPVVMSAINAPSEAEKKRLLTPTVRSAIVRDIMTTMYAKA